MLGSPVEHACWRCMRLNPEHLYREVVTQYSVMASERPHTQLSSYATHDNNASTSLLDQVREDSFGEGDGSNCVQIQ